MLIIGQVDAVSDQPGVKGQGQCHVGSNVEFLPESTTQMFVTDQDDSAAMSGVTGVVGPGPIKFGLDCNEQSGGIGYLFPHISYVELSPGSP